MTEYEVNKVVFKPEVINAGDKEQHISDLFSRDIQTTLRRLENRKSNDTLPPLTPGSIYGINFMGDDKDIVQITLARERTTKIENELRETSFIHQTGEEDKKIYLHLSESLLFYGSTKGEKDAVYRIITEKLLASYPVEVSPKLKKVFDKTMCSKLVFARYWTDKGIITRDILSKGNFNVDNIADLISPNIKEDYLLQLTFKPKIKSKSKVEVYVGRDSNVLRINHTRVGSKPFIETIHAIQKLWNDQTSSMSP